MSSTRTINEHAIQIPGAATLDSEARARTGVEAEMRPDIIPGAVFPDYELPDHRGKHRALSQLQGSDPLVLVLSRGGYCPKRKQHKGFSSSIARWKLATCRLVTISTGTLLEFE